MKLLVLDNYDSFTYNLVQYIQEILGHSIEVRRNDAISLDAVEDFDVIVLSPGPGLPADAGIMPALIKRYAPTKSILGVCLGHQAIGEAFGATLNNLANVYHGVSTPIQQLGDDGGFFAELDPVFEAGRYHSWVVNRASVPAELILTAEDEKGEIMAMRHREYAVYGVQFHPESVMTPDGKRMLKNFLALCAARIPELALS
jgi:anthranilate synthase component 2